MSTPLRRRLRRLRRVGGYGLLSVLILFALAVAVANQFLPVLQEHPREVAQWLSERIGRPVTLKAVSARWNRSGPLLTVSGLRIGQDRDALDIGHAQLQINAYSGFLPSVPLTELRVRGLDLELTRTESGEWRLEGLSGRAGAEPVDLRQIDGLGELQIEGATLRFLDEAKDRQWMLRRIDARLRTVGTKFRLGVVAHIDDSAPLQLVARLDRELRDGQLWLGGEKLALAPWLNGLPMAGVEAIQADGDLGLWLKLVDRQIVEARLDAKLSPLTLRGRDPIALDPARPEDVVEPRYGLDRAEAALRWRRTDAGWRLDIAQFDLDAGDARSTLAGVSVERTDALRFAASEFEVGPLLALAMLSDRPSPALRRWLYRAAPRGRLVTVDVDWHDSQHFRADGRVEAVAWLAAGAPGVAGIAGPFQADQSAASLRLDTPGLRIEAPGMLRAPLIPAAEGEINAFALDPGWRVELSGLRLSEVDYAFTVEGGIEWQGDGTRPLLDLRADVQPGPITAAKRFWILNKMPPKAVDWLDTALLDGRLVGGRALVRGDADHWPFRHHEGRFEAQADVGDLRLRYRHDWPEGHSVAGTARFINQSIDLDLSGRILGNRIEHTRGGIADLKKPILELETIGSGRGEDLLALLRSSPLQQRYGEYLAGLTVGGEGEVDLDLHIPLKETLGPAQVEGHVDLERADLRDAKWNLAFGAASGRVRFSHRGFSADELRVAFAQAPATLSIAVGDYTSDSARTAEASLRGHFAADTLLDAYPALHWIKPWIEGESDWNLQLNVPDAEEGVAKPQELLVRSDLVGTSLAFPAPLRKQAEGRLGLDLAIELPLATGGIDLRLGELMRLRGRLPENAPFAGVAAFGDAPEEALPERGLVAVGQVPVLDAAGWAAFALTSTGGDGGLLRADLHAGELDVLDRAFAETRLSFARDAEGALALSFAGAVLQGSLQIPTDDVATKGITARFERLHWPSRAPTGESALSHADPAAVPPLHLHISDFRFGEAKLGEARLETYPTPEGMHVEQLDTTSDDLALRASGDWTRIEGRERSNFHLTFDAKDLGAMLGALGFSKLIEGGQTRAELQATWPGAPSAFELQRIDGTLTATVGKGRVLEVNPGAGRIFGLLSLTEIPRRLALDFSDFFKSGLAFNEITGTFTLDGGNAYTQNLRIDGPAAEIRVRGRTGLKVKDYDQTMEVLPRAGSVLPALGAIAAGPAGAALGAVAQAVLQAPIKQMARTLYRVQGGWDKPDIDVIERGPKRGVRNAGREAESGAAPAIEPTMPLPVESLRTR